MHRPAPVCSPNAIGRRESDSLLVGVTLVAGVLLGTAWLAVDRAGQAPSLPAGPRLRLPVDREAASAQPEPFSGTTVYVSTSGTDIKSGTQSNPVRTIQRGVVLANQILASNTNARVLIAAGTYRESVDLGAQPHTNAVLLLEGVGESTILSGADDWSTGWTAQADGSYIHHWPYTWGMKPIPRGWDGHWNSDGNAYKRDILRRSEMVYVNGLPLRGVLKLSELTAGTFYVDETVAKLYMRPPASMTLAGSLIEVGIHVTPLRIAGRRNVVLKNFAVMRSRGAVQDTAALVVNSQNISVDNIIVAWAAYAGFGVSTSSNVQIRKSIFSDNGVYGTGCFKCLGIVLEDTEVARNNWRGWPAEHKGWDTVFKWGGSRDGVIRRCRFMDNMGSGIWFDGDNQRMLVEDSFSGRNGSHGLYAEANGGPITIRRSKACENGVDGFMNSRSNKVTLEDNQIFHNKYWQIATTGSDTPLTITDWQTGQTYVANAYDWTITGNKVVGGPLAGPLPNGCHPGPCGWNFWLLSQYTAVAQTATMDYNQYITPPPPTRSASRMQMAVPLISRRGVR